MTEWRTISIPKKFKEEIEEYTEETSFSGAKEFITYAARKEMDQKDTEEIVKKVLKEEDVID